MNYFQKNKKNIIIGVIATLLIAALVALWLQKKVIHSADDIVAVVYPSTLSVGDTLLFEDKTQFAKPKDGTLQTEQLLIKTVGSTSTINLDITR
jgi:ABC-type Mn2+/Zn2+ transport system permease subunit